ncbi:hypothetical protein COOONC_02808, partial [Cooperia oncophora]
MSASASSAASSRMNWSVTIYLGHKQEGLVLMHDEVARVNLQGKQWFTSLDLASGYWQFRVLPFGLTTAPAKFQRLMDKVLGDLIGPEVSVYIDDILIATDSVQRHTEVLHKVLLAFRKAQLK